MCNRNPWQEPPWGGQFLGEQRGRGLGTLVMKAVIDRLRELGYTRIRNSTVYKWNESSLKMHQKLGFKVLRETEWEYCLDLEL